MIIEFKNKCREELKMLGHHFYYDYYVYNASVKNAAIVNVLNPIFIPLYNFIENFSKSSFKERLNDNRI